MKIREDSKAEIKWTFKDSSYYYSKMEVKIIGEDLEITLKGSHLPKMVERVQGFKAKTALDVIVEEERGQRLGRIFDSGIKEVYHDLYLSIGYTSTLKSAYKGAE